MFAFDTPYALYRLHVGPCLRLYASIASHSLGLYREITGAFEITRDQARFYTVVSSAGLSMNFACPETGRKKQGSGNLMVMKPASRLLKGKSRTSSGTTALACQKPSATF